MQKAQKPGFFSALSPQETPIDKLIFEFGHVSEADQHALRENIKNPKKVYSQLSFMRRAYVPQEQETNLSSLLQLVSKEDYLAIFYCLDDNLEAFLARFPGDNKKKFEYLPLAIAAQSPKIVEHLSKGAEHDMNLALAAIDATILVKPYDANQLDAAIKRAIQINKEITPEIITRIGLSAAHYANHDAWAIFISLLNVYKVYLSPNIAERMLFNAVCSGNVSTCSFCIRN